MKSISFKLKEDSDSFAIGFDKLCLNTLNTITRIMDIEGYDEPLNIEVDYELYREIKELLCTEHWVINLDHTDPNELAIKINGFELIFKQIKTT